MQRTLLIVIVMTSSLATADADRASGYVEVAREAAERGQCDVVKERARKVRELAPVYYETSFVTDPAIAACLAERVPPVSKPGTPPLSARRLVSELALGTLSGIGGLYLGVQAGEALCIGGSREGEEPCLYSAIAGGLLGGALALSLGVYVAGTVGDEHGSLPATLGGSLAAGLVGIAIVANAESNDAAFYALLGLPIVGALTAFNLTRRYRQVSVTVAPLGIAGRF